MKINTSTPCQHLFLQGVESEMAVNSMVAEKTNTSTPFSYVRTCAGARARGAIGWAGKGVKGVKGVEPPIRIQVTLEAGDLVTDPIRPGLSRFLKIIQERHQNAISRAAERCGFKCIDYRILSPESRPAAKRAKSRSTNAK